MSSVPISSINLHFDYDLVAARRRARLVAALLGFDAQDQTRIATVASEIARNALRYAGGGTVEFSLDTTGDEQALCIQVSDRGPGIENVKEVLDGRYRSSTGMGIGMTGARRLMDQFDVSTIPGRGTTVTMSKKRPSSAPILRGGDVTALVERLNAESPKNAMEEIQQQNAELLQALADINERQQELERLNRELEDTNRGVLALYAELDEKADHLRRADQLKTRFLSDMSHEFRTPVNSILALTRLLDEAVLNDEGRKQVSLIRRAADDLAALVNDLLDLAKIEAGKIEVRPNEFEVANLFSALRGMLRPLLVNRALALTFDDPEGLPPMWNDEAKVSQILRNFISNALKFTEAGEVRVTGTMSDDGSAVIFSVTDTGIGISSEDQELIFQEFTQIDSPLQRKQKGTGLGLPLTRKLAALLGGRVGVRSQLGIGSTFWAEIPLRYAGTGAPETPAVRGASSAVRQGGLTVLVIDDDETSRYTLSKFAKRENGRVVQAENGLQGMNKAHTEHPDIILLDLMMPGIGGHEVLARLKSDAATSLIPVIIVTSRFVNDEERRQILTRASAVINKAELSREVVSAAIDAALQKASNSTP